MTKFDFFRFFSNDNDSNSTTQAKKQQKQRRGRICRIEQLEEREMLSVTPWSLVDDVFNYVDMGSAAVYTLNTGEFTPPANAQIRDLAVYNDLIARGYVEGNFQWNQDGQITQINIAGKGLTGALDVSGLTALEHLDCSLNDLTSLNVTDNTALTYLNVTSNRLATLDVSTNTALLHLGVSGNELKT